MQACMYLFIFTLHSKISLFKLFGAIFLPLPKRSYGRNAARV